MVIVTHRGEVEMLLDDDCDLHAVFARLGDLAHEFRRHVAETGDIAWSIRVEVETNGGSVSLLEMIREPSPYAEPAN